MKQTTYVERPGQGQHEPREEGPTCFHKAERNVTTEVARIRRLQTSPELPSSKTWKHTVGDEAQKENRETKEVVLHERKPHMKPLESEDLPVIQHNLSQQCMKKVNHSSEP